VVIVADYVLSNEVQVVYYS